MENNDGSLPDLQKIMQEKLTWKSEGIGLLQYYTFQHKGSLSSLSCKPATKQLIAKLVNDLFLLLACFPQIF